MTKIGFKILNKYLCRNFHSQNQKLLVLVYAYD